MPRRCALRTCEGQVENPEFHPHEPAAGQCLAPYPRRSVPSALGADDNGRAQVLSVAGASIAGEDARCALSVTGEEAGAMAEKPDKPDHPQQPDHPDHPDHPERPPGPPNPPRPPKPGEVG